jgi:hypothetical protein
MGPGGSGTAREGTTSLTRGGGTLPSLRCVGGGGVLRTHGSGPEAPPGSTAIPTMSTSSSSSVAARSRIGPKGVRSTPTVREAAAGKVDGAELVDRGGLSEEETLGAGVREAGRGMVGRTLALMNVYGANVIP